MSSTTRCSSKIIFFIVSTDRCVVHEAEYAIHNEYHETGSVPGDCAETLDVTSYSSSNNAFRKLHTPTPSDVDASFKNTKYVFNKSGPHYSAATDKQRDQHLAKKFKYLHRSLTKTNYSDQRGIFNHSSRLFKNIMYKVPLIDPVKYGINSSSNFVNFPLSSNPHIALSSSFESSQLGQSPRNSNGVASLQATDSAGSPTQGRSQLSNQPASDVTRTLQLQIGDKEAFSTSRSQWRRHCLCSSHLRCSRPCGKLSNTNMQYAEIIKC